MNEPRRTASDERSGPGNEASWLPRDRKRYVIVTYMLTQHIYKIVCPIFGWGLPTPRAPSGEKRTLAVSRDPIVRIGHYVTCICSDQQCSMRSFKTQTALVPSHCSQRYTTMIPVVIILACALTCFGVRHDLEAEHADIINTTGTGENYREAASGGIAVNLLWNDYLQWYLNVTRSCDFKVLSVQYSNDGFSDTVDLVLNGTTIGSFRTEAVSREGEWWNVFKSSGTVGNPMSLFADEYTLKLIVRSADEDGVDIDKVILQLNSSCIPVSVNVPPDDSPTTLAGTSAGTTPANVIETVEVAVGISGTLVGLIVAIIGVIGIYFKCRKMNFCRTYKT